MKKKFQGKKINFLLLILVSAIIICGCQSIHYKAEPTPIITLKKVQNTEHDFKYNEDLSFWFWGFTPSPYLVNLTDLAMKNGAERGITDLKIREEATILNAIVTFLTLGIYSPRNVEITGVKVK